MAFILIKFIIYPLIGLVFGTNYPIVAVVSESMEHNQRFDSWWANNKAFYEQRNITKEEFRDYPFTGGFNKGDIMVLVGKDPTTIDQGDVIVFHSAKPYPIIHRVVAVENGYFQTKGDNNPTQIVLPELNEKYVPHNYLFGKAVARVPFIGYVKIWFVELLNLLGIPAV